MRYIHPILLLGAAGILYAFPASAWCNMDSYNAANPPAPISDVNDSYPDIALEWGSDVDPYQCGQRAWHYVKNLHDQKVSVDWPKTGIWVPFRQGLPTDAAHCQKHRDSEGERFTRDDAPMKINSYPLSPASAFLRSQGVVSKATTPETEPAADCDTDDTATSSTTIESGYVRDGEEIPLSVEVFFFYFSEANRHMIEMIISYVPSEIGVAIPNEIFSFGQETLAKAAEGSEFKLGDLRELVSMDEASSARFSSILDDDYFLFRGLGKHVIAFEANDLPAAIMPLVVVDPQGSLVTAGQLFFDGAERFR